MTPCSAEMLKHHVGFASGKRIKLKSKAALGFALPIPDTWALKPLYCIDPFPSRADGIIAIHDAVMMLFKKHDFPAAIVFYDRFEVL